MDEYKSHKWLITVTVMTGAVMAALDTSIINVALPNMRGSLGCSVEEITWVSTGYILSSVIIMPIISLLSSRFGRKRFFIFCVLLFTSASVLCGMAWDLTSMVIFRIIQGIGGGALIPISQAILRETFPPKEQAMAMAIFGLGVIMGPAFGPTLGGWLTDNYSWPWIFYFKAPIGIVNIFLVMKFIHDPPFLAREKGTWDFAGLFFMLIGLGALQIMLEKGNQNDWFASNFIICLAIIAGAGLILFTWRELTTEKPAVDLRILKDLNFASATFLGGILGMCLFGSLFIVPLFLQQLLNYPVFDSGLALLPRTIAMGVIMPIAGTLYNRTGPRLLIGLGLVLNVISFYQFSRLALNVGYWDIFWPQAMQGLGFGFIFVSLTTAVLSTIENRFVTAAAGLYNVTRQVSASIGITLSATLLTRGENWNRALLMEHINIFTDRTSDTLRILSSYFYSRGMDAAGAYDRALKVVEGVVTRHSSMLSYNHVFFIMAVVFLISIPLIFLIKNPKMTSKIDAISE